MNQLELEHAEAHRREGPVKQLSERKHGRRWFAILILIVVIAVAGGLLLRRARPQSTLSNSKPAPSPGRGMPLAVPVIAGTVAKQDVPIFLDGLGTVQAFNTVTVRARVDGQVQQILFKEGQDVRVGDLLAQIDPAPFQAQLDQVVAKKAEDSAQLAVARITLKRNADLLTD